MSKALTKGAKTIASDKVRKWNESCWKLTIYIFFTTFAFLVSYKEPWFTDTRYFWLGCTHFPPCNMFVKQGAAADIVFPGTPLYFTADIMFSGTHNFI
jgi:ceramide synthetase